MKINVDVNDIFRYVVGNTNVDPIEAQIDFDDRYEVFDETIYDHHRKEFLPQSESFKVFSKEVSKLRATSNTMNRESILDECSRLAKSAIDIDLD